jgi:hypothetical protein
MMQPPLLNVRNLVTVAVDATVIARKANVVPIGLNAMPPQRAEWNTRKNW